MPIAKHILDSMQRSSMIRKMFEEGIRLKSKFGDENVFDFSIGNPDVEPPKEFFDALKELSSHENPDSMTNRHGYMPNAGFETTRAAIADSLAKEYGLAIKADNIMMTCGAAGGLNTVFKTILNPGEQIIVPKPYFPEYNFYADNHNGQMVPVESNADFSLNIENIKAAINGKTKGVLINSPNNPTGMIYSEDDIIKLSELLSEQYNAGKCIYLISDEPYKDIIYDGNAVPCIFKYYNNSLIINSYSKTLSVAGERIGYVAVNPLCDDISNMIAGLILSNRILGYINAPALMQRIIERILHVTVNTDLYKKRRDMFIEGLQSAGYVLQKPEGAFYLFPETPVENDVEFVAHLQKFNILVVPGSGFGGPGHFRISYAVPEKVIERSIPKFKEALESI
ncbi:MAG: pyridoxal phosphate-dependent aminotransferase [Spirochaetes bacterium]|nr:pyridoxal phosphate-dependent aminotransferase [Spirochaetota bacterium]